MSYKGLRNVLIKLLALSTAGLGSGFSVLCCSLAAIETCKAKLQQLELSVTGTKLLPLWSQKRKPGCGK